MLNLDRRYNLTCDALDPIVLRMRWEFKDGTPREIPGDATAFGFQIYGNGVPDGQKTAAGTYGETLIDGVIAQYVEMAHEPALGAALAGLPALFWKVGEVLPSPDGMPTRVDNLLDYAPRITVRRVPAMSGVTAPVTGEGEILMIVFTEGE